MANVFLNETPIKSLRNQFWIEIFLKKFKNVLKRFKQFDFGGEIVKSLGEVC